MKISKSRPSSVSRKLNSRLLGRFMAAIAIPAIGLLSPVFLGTARAQLSPSATEIGLSEDASPEEVLDRLCDQLKEHPEDSIAMAQWAVAYFQQQIRNTPAFASALGIVFADCLSSTGTVGEGELTSPLAEQIAETLLAIYAALEFLPAGKEVGTAAVLAAIASLDPRLASDVIAAIGASPRGTSFASNSRFIDTVPPTGDSSTVIQQESAVLNPDAPTPLPTATPPVTPVVNP